MGRRALSGRIAASPHQIERRDGHLICLRCRGKATASRSRTWLASACEVGERFQDGVRGVSVKFDQQTVHSTHNHSFHEGLSLHYCGICGSMARTSTYFVASRSCEALPRTLCEGRS